MSNVILYAHGGSGNHGCEAIVRTTHKILGGQPLMLISSNPEEDQRYGLGRICTLVRDREERLDRKSIDFFKGYLQLKLKQDFIPLEKLYYKKSFSAIQRGDIAMSIGGDNYCYADAYRYTMLHEVAKKRGAKTVLWGCSVEPELLNNPAIAGDLANYDLITARETISYEALKAVNPNTVLVADPAFCLERVDLPLPKGFVAENTLGINISPMIMGKESSPGIAMENYRRLIRYALEKTDMAIALIPHVVWQDNDDRIPLETLYQEFQDSGRVILIGDHTCEELKGFIARCRFFVGARTHATIAAYSSVVPTLVVGYSVKARGIARDLFGTEEGYVLPVQQLQRENDLLDQFCWFQAEEKKLRERLAQIMPRYKERALDGLSFF